MSKKSGGSGISLNKVAFWLLVVLAILCLVNIILAAIGGFGNIIGYLQAVATAVAVCVVAILAWRYVSHKPTIWKVLYFVVLLVVIAGIIVPAVL